MTPCQTSKKERAHTLLASFELDGGAPPRLEKTDGYDYYDGRRASTTKTVFVPRSTLRAASRGGTIATCARESEPWPARCFLEGNTVAQWRFPGGHMLPIGKHPEPPCHLKLSPVQAPEGKRQ